MPDDADEVAADLTVYPRQVRSTELLSNLSSCKLFLVC